MTDEDYMRLAIKEAEKAASEGNWPIGCVLVLNDKIIAKSQNSIYTSGNRLAHAELSVLISEKETIFENPGEITLYTTFEPCPMCFGACINARLKRVVFGGDYNGSGGSHLKDHLKYLYDDERYKTVFDGGVLEKECEEVYRHGEAKVLNNRGASEK